MSLESYLGDHPKKRQRVEIEDLLNEEDNDPIRRVQRKRKEGKPKALTEIKGRQGEGPLNYQKLAREMMVKVSLLDLYQISPDLSRAFKRLSTRVSKREHKKHSNKEKNRPQT